MSSMWIIRSNTSVPVSTEAAPGNRSFMAVGVTLDYSATYLIFLALLIPDFLVIVLFIVRNQWISLVYSFLSLYILVSFRWKPNRTPTCNARADYRSLQKSRWRRMWPVDHFSSVLPFAATLIQMLANRSELTEAEKERKNAVSHFRPRIFDVYVQRPISNLREHIILDSVQQK